MFIKKIIIRTFLLIFLISTKNLSAQKLLSKQDTDSLEKANYFVIEGKYKKALPTLLNLNNKYKGSDDIYELFGICYSHSSDEREKALDYFDKIKLKTEIYPNVNNLIGDVYALEYKYDEAISYYEKHLSQKLSAEESKIIKRKIARCNYGKELIKTPANVFVTNVGNALNTKDGEYVPVINADESIMIYTYRGVNSKGGLMTENFISDKDGDYFEDIYTATKNGNRWKDPKPIDNLNTKQHDAAIAISPDGQKLFVYKTSRNQAGDIYISNLDGAIWTEPKKLKGDVNTDKYWEGSASISPDGKTLYFASERSGGYGGRDLYKASLQYDGSWRNVQNLGSQINTEEDDDAPFIHNDGKIFHFSSKGHQSMGGYDIFQSVKINEDTWTLPINIGYPINTSDDEKYYVITADGKTAYYSSAKKGGFGEQDIYKIVPGLLNYKSVLILTKGTITFEDEPVKASIEIRYSDTKETFGRFASNANTGKYLVTLPSGFNYDILFIYDTLTIAKSILCSKVDSFTEIIVDAKFYKEPTKQRLANMSTDLINLLSADKTDSTLITNNNKNVLEKIATQEMSGKNVENKSVVGNNSDKIIQGKIETYTYDKFLTEFGDTTLFGVIFKVQIGAYRMPDNFNFEKVKKQGNVDKKFYDDGITRFTIGGDFKTLKDADEYKNIVVKKGVTDTFVTAIYENRRVYLKEIFAIYGKENIK